MDDDASALEEEAGQEGAFNEETGEINWDCPCLGGMAHGPCGDQFKAAFSCFVYSKEEPKGVDCIEHFKTMQNCFREHPEEYGAELDEDEAAAAEMGDGQERPVGSEPTPVAGSAALRTDDETSRHGEKVVDLKNATRDPEPIVEGKQSRAQAATEQVKQQHEPMSETEDAVPKAWHDSR